MLALRCARCRAIYRYEARDVIVANDVLQKKPMPDMEDCVRIADVIVCKRCGTIDEYAWTAQAKMAIMSHSSIQKGKGPVSLRE